MKMGLKEAEIERFLQSCRAEGIGARRIKKCAYILK